MIEKDFVTEGLKRTRIDEYLEKELERAGYGGMDVQITPLGTMVVVYAERPGMVIGRGGKNVRAITNTLKNDFGLDNPQIEVKEVSVVIEKKRGRKPKIEVNGKDVNKEIKKEVKKVKKELKPATKELKKKAKPVVKAIGKETKPLKKKIEKEIKPVKREVKKTVKSAKKTVNKAKREVKKAVIKEEIKKEIKEVKKKGRPKKTN